MSHDSAAQPRLITTVADPTGPRYLPTADHPEPAMKSCLGLLLSLLILLVVVGTAGGIWYLSQSATFSRHSGVMQPPGTAAHPAAPPKAVLVSPNTPPPPATPPKAIPVTPPPEHRSP